MAELAGRTVSLDPALASAWFFGELEKAGANIVRQRDPVLLPKACKNETEIAGTEAAHIRDGAALTRFLHWLDTDAQSGEMTEIDAALKLESFREQLCRNLAADPMQLRLVVGSGGMLTDAGGEV